MPARRALISSWVFIGLAIIAGLLHFHVVAYGFMFVAWIYRFQMPRPKLSWPEGLLIFAAFSLVATSSLVGSPVLRMSFVVVGLMGMVVLVIRAIRWDVRLFRNDDTKTSETPRA
jgi:hypothetical protein